MPRYCADSGGGADKLIQSLKALGGPKAAMRAPAERAAKASANRKPKAVLSPLLDRGSSMLLDELQIGPTPGDAHRPGCCGPRLAQDIDRPALGGRREIIVPSLQRAHCQPGFARVDTSCGKSFKRSVEADSQLLGGRASGGDFELHGRSLNNDGPAGRVLWLCALRLQFRQLRRLRLLGSLPGSRTTSVALTRHSEKPLLVHCRCPLLVTLAQCPLEFSSGLKWHLDQTS